MMLKFGVISEIDLDKYLARVYFEEDDFVSPWLKISAPRVKGDQVTFPFDINEHVYCILDENWEYGVVAGAVYDESNLPSGAASGKLQIKMSDNTLISYDRNSHTLYMDIKGPVIIKGTEISIQAGTVDIDAVNTKVTGILTVEGAATIKGVASVGGLAGIDGGSVAAENAVIEAKEVKVTDDVSIGTVSLKSHKHTVPSGGGISGPPQNCGGISGPPQN